MTHGPDQNPVHLFFTFYSPPLSTMSSGFLQAEGLEPICPVSPPSVSAIKALEDRSAHVIQSALSQKSGPAPKGVAPSVVHFAQANEMDGFFITACEPDPDINWAKLEGVDVVLSGGGEPLAMFKYARHKAGSTTPRSMPSTRAAWPISTRPLAPGRACTFKSKGLFSQQLEYDGVGHVVA